MAMSQKDLMLLGGIGLGLGVIAVASTRIVLPPITLKGRLPGKPTEVSRDVNLLEPGTKAAYLTLEQRMLKNHGIKLQRGRTKATLAQGIENYDKGTTGIATGITWHVLGRAIDVYCYDPKTGKLDMNASIESLYRTLHQEWFALKGHGICFKPYPNGPKHFITNKQGKKLWDAGHLEFHGPYATLQAAYTAEKKNVIA